MQKSIILLFILISFHGFSQTVFEFDKEKSISVDGLNAPIPFSQGINSAQIQTIDLNNDSVEEWVIWDINSGTLQIFEKNEENFKLRPELRYFFPSDISGFFGFGGF